MDEEEAAESDENDDEVDDFQNMADGLLTKMNQDLLNMQEQSADGKGKMRKVMIIQLSVLSTQTRIERNSMGLLSMSDLQLINLDKRIADLDVEKHNVRV